MKESLQEATQRALLEGYKNLNENKSKKLKKENFNHINDVWSYLEQSKNEDDLEERIGDIPSKFGTFTYELINNGETARVRNDYEEYGDYDYDEVDIDFLDYLEENKSKKTEAKLEDIQMEIYEMIQTARKVDKQDKDTNIKETLNAIRLEYPEINREELKSYIERKADEIYAGDYDEKTESKKVETAQRLYVVQSNYGDGWEDVYSSEDRDDAKARLKEYEENEKEYAHRFITRRPDTSIRDVYRDLHNDITAKKAKWGESKKVESVERDFKAEFCALPEKEKKKYKKCIPPLRRGLSNVEAETIAKERGLDAGILWWVTNIGQLTNFKESKKVEAEEDTTSAPDYLEKAFEVEVEYWLKALVDENSNDEIGKKAQEVLDDKAKMKSIVDELVNGSDDLWEDIHRRIEELTGLHYRESSRVNENKKVTEDVDEDKVNLYDTVWDQISCYDEEYAQEQGIDKLDDEDVYNIIAEIMSRPDVQDIIREEIEDYAGRKNN